MYIESEHSMLTNREIGLIFEEYQLMRSKSTNVTDGQTTWQYRALRRIAW